MWGVSRNLMSRRTVWRAARQPSPDLMLLHEVNLGSAVAFRQAAGADWLIWAADLRTHATSDRPVRVGPRCAWLPVDVPLPGGPCWLRSAVDGAGLTAVFYYAQTGLCQVGIKRMISPIYAVC
jgi:hypothetical protein